MALRESDIGGPAIPGSHAHEALISADSAFFNSNEQKILLTRSEHRSINLSHRAPLLTESQLGIEIPGNAVARIHLIHGDFHKSLLLIDLGQKPLKPDGRYLDAFPH